MNSISTLNAKKEPLVDADADVYYTKENVSLKEYKIHAMVYDLGIVNVPKIIHYNKNTALAEEIQAEVEKNNQKAIIVCAKILDDSDIKYILYGDKERSDSAGHTLSKSLPKSNKLEI